MIKYTKTTLKKIELLFKDIDYKIRYEKGHFQSGYCVVENQNIAVINKFFDTEARINCLLEIFKGLEINQEISEECLGIYNIIQKEFSEQLNLEFENKT